MAAIFGGKDSREGVYLISNKVKCLFHKGSTKKSMSMESRHQYN